MATVAGHLLSVGAQHFSRSSARLAPHHWPARPPANQAHWPTFARALFRRRQIVFGLSSKRRPKSCARYAAHRWRSTIGRLAPLAAHRSCINCAPNSRAAAGLLLACENPRAAPAPTHAHAVRKCRWPKATICCCCNSQTLAPSGLSSTTKLARQLLNGL